MPFIYVPKDDKPKGHKCWKPWAWLCKEWSIWQCKKCGKKFRVRYFNYGGDGEMGWERYEDS